MGQQVGRHECTVAVAADADPFGVDHAFLVERLDGRGAAAEICSTYVSFIVSGSPTTGIVALSSTAYPCMTKNNWEGPIIRVNMYGEVRTWPAVPGSLYSSG